MTPTRKFHLVVTLSTVGLMAVLLPIAIRQFDLNGSSNGFVVFLVGVIGAAGSYTGLAKLLIGAFNNWPPVKRLMLGKRYLEGTWIGTYNAQSTGEKIYSVEHFIQDLETLRIEGVGYRANGDVFDAWESKAACIDENTMELAYAYSCTQEEETPNNTKRDTHFDGIAIFKIGRSSSDKYNKENPEMTLRGHSADLVHEPGIIRNDEYRLNTKLLDPKDEAFPIALERFGSA